MRSWLESQPRTSLAWLAFLRIGIGLVFLTQGIDKLIIRPSGGQNPTMGSFFSDPARLRGVLTNAVSNTDVVYGAFLQGVAIPNAGAVAWLMTVGELLVAASLILGLFTRVGAIGAVFLMINTMWMKGLPNNGGWTDRFVGLASLIVLFTNAGYVFGLDGVLRDRLPSWLHPLMSAPPEELRRPEPEGRPTVQPAS